MDSKQNRNERLYNYWVSHGHMSFAKIGRVFHISKARAYQIVKSIEVINKTKLDDELK